MHFASRWKCRKNSNYITHSVRLYSANGRKSFSEIVEATHSLCNNYINCNNQTVLLLSIISINCTNVK
jgi:hypothetical protein